MPEFTQKPKTSSKISSLWLRVTGRDRWVPATALVFSDEFASKPGPNTGHHHVTYSYVVGAERYSGNFYEYDFEAGGFKKNDQIPICYNPQHPSKSYYPDQRTDTRFRSICFTIGGTLGIIVSAVQLYRAWHDHW